MSPRSVAALLLAGLALGACGVEGAKLAGTEADPDNRTVTEKDFDPKGNFSAPTRVDNRWHPLAPGTQFVFEGRSNRGLGPRPHRVIFTVTGLTKRVDGVDAVVLFDRDINRNKLLEAEITFFAQDDDGNVWNFGEYPEEYAEDGSFDGAPSTWLSGRLGAQAGVLMRGDPQPGTPPYMQGSAPKIGFGDTARVVHYEPRHCVPVGCFENVLVVDENNPLDPGDGHQFKYYADGVGNISVAPGKGGKEREILELVKVQTLRPKTLAKLDRWALRLDRRAYRTVKNVWARSAAAKARG
ncbi:hypothetical protein OM076_09200 [Solirubrobacter ginsenosidimutans]|uniref:Uncharacterized protein n=1 Tax=Solirubrobacter ginsenosidimutans TaxID=490573 RepID=A0A9X3S1T9_9ACTN|nr:hypothetical protein [Solirubrobacter ginsenosidimutans]MDA0160441.1 hypothetical protein [Solirubrobacter ginsenosidimutans]